MIKKNVLLFVPMIGGGGVEKNLFLIANYLSNKFQKISIISTSKEYKNKFNKNVEFITPKNKFWNKSSRRIKYLVCLLLLFLEFKKNKKIIVFCFQANVYCILLCKILGIKVIVRSNTSPSGWAQNSIKKKFL